MPRLVDPSYDVLSLRPVCTMVGILFVYLVVTILLKSIYLEKMKLLAAGMIVIRYILF